MAGAAGRPEVALSLSRIAGGAWTSANLFQYRIAPVTMPANPKAVTARRRVRGFTSETPSVASLQAHNMTTNKMWGGRFAQGPAAIMEEINTSIDFDKRLAAHDLAGSEAHAAMLAKQGIIEKSDADTIRKG